MSLNKVLKILYTKQKSFENNATIKGFAQRIGYATSLLAEFCALRDGLQIAIWLGINYLEVELDAKTVVQLT